MVVYLVVDPLLRNVLDHSLFSCDRLVLNKVLDGVETLYDSLHRHIHNIDHLSGLHFDVLLHIWDVLDVFYNSLRLLEIVLGIRV